MRRDQQRLEDILEALDSLAMIVPDRKETDLINDKTFRYAVSHSLTIVGEAASRLTSDLKGRYSAIPWRDIIALRNVLVHEYFGIHWPFVWRTATVFAPDLRLQIVEILRREFSQ